ncbi:MAG: hypothetical protein ACHQFX_04685 [Chitinophagales bacterium]
MSSVQEKLYNYEQTPPPKVWDKINAALDESHLSDEFPSTLYNAEVMPPANAWDKIAGALEPVQAPVVPMRSKTFSFFRYAVAAVLIGIVAFAVIKWTNGNDTRTYSGIAATDSSKNKRSTNDPAKVEEIKPATEGLDETIAAATDPQIKTTTIKRARNNYTIPDDLNEIEPIYAYNEHTPNLADRYFMLMTPDGGIIRMSKKWGNLVCCVSGQDQDENCKDQLKKWQEKIACSPVTTSAGNFMDVLSLVSALNDSEL